VPAVPTGISDPAAVERLARLVTQPFRRIDVWAEAVAADKQTLERLGAAFERARLDELSTSGYEQAPASAQTGDLDEATRDELYEKAKEADIPGRSQMNKEDLREALREQT
jgi:hypothetical protein